MAILSSTDGGILELSTGKFNIAANSRIQAGDNSFVDIVNSTINGGLLQATGTGRFRGTGNVRFTSPANNPVTIADNTPVDLHNGFDHTLEGEIVNRGTITLQAGDRTTRLFIDAEASVSGNGTIRLASELPTNPARLGASSADAVLNIASGQRVEVTGSIERGLTVNNQGTISANVNGRTLSISPTGSHRIVNAGGTLAAENGSTLHLLRSWDLTSPTSGDLQAGDQSVVLLDGVRASSHRLRTPDNDTFMADAAEIDAEKGVIRTQGVDSVFDVRNSATFNEGLLEIANNSGLTLRGNPVEMPSSSAPTLENEGTILLNADPNGAATINVNRGDVRLAGGGQVVLANGGGRNTITQSAVDLRTNTLVNEDNVVEGRGNLGGTRLKIVNGADGTFRANLGGEFVVAPAVNVDFDVREVSAENFGLWEAVDGSQFTIRGGAFRNHQSATMQAVGERSLLLVDGADGIIIMGSSTSAREGGRLRFSGSELVASDVINVAEGSALEVHNSTINLSFGRLDAIGENSRIDLSGGSVLNNRFISRLQTGSGGVIRNLDQATLVRMVLNGDFVGTDGSNTILQTKLDAFAGGEEPPARVFVSGFSQSTRLTIAQSDEDPTDPFHLVRSTEIILTGGLFNHIIGRVNSSRLRMEGGVIRGGGRISGLRLEVMEGSQIIADGRIPVPESAGSDDVEVEIAGMLAINTTNEDDVLQNGGRLAAVDGGTLTIEDSRLINYSAGRIDVDPESTLRTRNLINNGIFIVAARGTAQVNGTLEQSEGGAGLRTTIAGELTANRANIDFGFVTIDGEVTITEGNSAFRLSREASLGGRGTINGKLVTSGIFHPGDSPGTFTVNGDFEQLPGGRLEIEIAGPKAGLMYDQLVVGETAVLDGTVVVKHLDGFAPDLGTQFDVARATTLVDNGFSLAMLDGPLVRPTMVDAADGTTALRLTSIAGKRYVPVSGSWNDAANWTDGTLPGADDTAWFIGDPSADTSVTGPAADVPVYSLVVGSGDESIASSTTLDLGAGIITTTRGTTLRRNAKLIGSGTLDGDLYNAGIVAPSDAPGIIKITGDYNQSEIGALAIELGGTTPGAQFDQLTVDGTAALDGILEVELVDLGDGVFAPTFGDVFTILTAANEVGGQFATLSLPPLDEGLGWIVDYLPTSVVLRTGIAGDYNDDGVVDAADYTVWRDNLGLATTLPGENPAAATPGVVDEEDYEFWKSSFGQLSANSEMKASSVSASVPEPSTFVMCLAFVIFSCSRRAHHLCVHSSALRYALLID